MAGESANMANPSTEAVNLIVSTAALPFRTSCDGSASAILLTIVTDRKILMVPSCRALRIGTHVSELDRTIADFLHGKSND